MKVAQAGCSLWSSAIESIKNIGGAIFGIGCDLSPALLAVGYIIGLSLIHI